MTSPAATVLLAATKGIPGQEKLSVAVVFAILLAWGGYIVYALTRRDAAEPVGSELELAPNRKPYFDDDELETKRLDRALIFALFMLVVVAVGLPLYWLKEPGRQKGALVGFNNDAIKRGYGWFQSTSAPTSPEFPVHFGCADCHGANGGGGVTTASVSDPAHKDIPPHKVSWSVPPLNTVLLRYEGSSEAVNPNAPVGTALDSVRSVIIYGRPGTPMPPWGLAGGGALDDQQINDLVAFIQSIQLSPAQAAKDWADRAKQTAVKEGKLDALGNPIVDGQVLFDTNCARCHTKGYSYGEPGPPGSGGAYAPNITGGSELRQFPLLQDQIDFVTNGEPYGKGYGSGINANSGGGIATNAGGGMPHFGAYLSQAEITEIVEYERSL